MNKVAAFIAVINGAILINAVGAATLRWLQTHLQATGAASTGSWALPMARRGMVIVVFAMAGMVSLDILGINISPLIAGLGIGGLAVALAIQPTLSNLFAGTYVITEGVVSVGDYIDMEGGVSGYVVDVNCVAPGCVPGPTTWSSSPTRGSQRPSLPTTPSRTPT